MKIPVELLAVITKVQNEKKSDSIVLKHTPTKFVSYKPDGSVMIQSLPYSGAVSSEGRVYKTLEMQWLVTTLC